MKRCAKCGLTRSLAAFRALPKGQQRGRVTTACCVGCREVRRRSYSRVGHRSRQVGSRSCARCGCATRNRMLCRLCYADASDYPFATVI